MTNIGSGGSDGGLTEPVNISEPVDTQEQNSVTIADVNDIIDANIQNRVENHEIRSFSYTNWDTSSPIDLNDSNEANGRLYDSVSVHVHNQSGSEIDVNLQVQVNGNYYTQRAETLSSGAGISINYNSINTNNSLQLSSPSNVTGVDVDYQIKFFPE